MEMGVRYLLGTPYSRYPRRKGIPARKQGHKFLRLWSPKDSMDAPLSAYLLTTCTLTFQRIVRNRRTSLQIAGNLDNLLEVSP